MTTRYTIAHVATDEFGVFPGPGWVILENGKRIDWPMQDSVKDAAADMRDLQKSDRQLAADEASEAHGLRMMGSY